MAQRTEQSAAHVSRPPLKKYLQNENEKTMETKIENIRLYLIQPSVIPVNYDVIDRDGTAHGVEYEIVCGERRYRACSLLKMETIPCIVRQMSDDEALDAMIAENLQRKDVDPIEESEAFRLLQGKGQSVEELALRFGKSEKYVRDRMRLSGLIEPLRVAVSRGQMPLRGGYLLARLSEDEQREFLSDEFDEEGLAEDDEATVSDVTRWLDRRFMNLEKSVFQEDAKLTEAWNPDGKLIRRCATCECNTKNQGCLFADMNTGEAQCTYRACYEQKELMYMEWFLDQYADQFVREGCGVTKGRMHIVLERTDEPYGENEKLRLARLKEKVKEAGYRVFGGKELTRYYGPPDALLKKGELVAGIDLYGMACWNLVKVAYYRPLVGREAADAADSEKHYMVARLCEKSAAIEDKARRKIMRFAREKFDHVAYQRRKGKLEPWEENIIVAMVFDQMNYEARSNLLPGCGYGVQTYQQIAGFRKRQDELDAEHSWMRQAIVAYCQKEQNKDFYMTLASRTTDDVERFARETRDDAYERQESIHQELKEMGYDENGNKL